MQTLGGHYHLRLIHWKIQSAFFYYWTYCVHSALVSVTCSLFQVTLVDWVQVIRLIIATHLPEDYCTNKIFHYNSLEVHLVKSG